MLLKGPQLNRTCVFLWCRVFFSWGEGSLHRAVRSCDPATDPSMNHTTHNYSRHIRSGGDRAVARVEDNGSGEATTTTQGRSLFGWYSHEL